MRKIANNLFYNWKTTLLGVVIALLTVFLIKEDVLTSEVLNGAIGTAGAFLSAWLGFGARDKMPFGNKTKKDGGNISK